MSRFLDETPPEDPSLPSIWDMAVNRHNRSDGVELILRTKRQYRTAAGQTVGPLNKMPNGHFWARDLGTWKPDGTHILNPQLNIIAEID